MNSKIQSKHIAGLYREAAEKYPDMTAFAGRGKTGVFEPTNFKDIYEMGLNLATGLIDLGINARDHIAVLADNRFDWILSDCGIQLSGAANVPRGTDVTKDDILYIVDHSDAVAVFVEHEAMLKRFLEAKSELPKIKHIIVMDQGFTGSDDALGMYALLEKGKKLRKDGDRRAEERIAAISSEDLFTLIYTSGTTGTPKGVMLTHANMISQVRNLPVELVPGDSCVSILPVWHIFERVFEMLCLGHGVATYYTTLRNIKEDLKLVRPTIMGSAPRLWESVYTGIRNNVAKSSGIKRGLFAAAYFCSQRFQGALRFFRGHLLNTDDRSIFMSAFLFCWHLDMLLIFMLPYFLLDVIVLKKIRAATGGRLRMTISGGGALPPHIDDFFNNIGIPVLEGYGMTETCPVLAVRTFPKLVIGSVGPIWPETEVQLVDPASGEVIYPPRRGQKGELHVKGPQIMKGYYKNEEETAKVFKDGWLNTGDLCMITYNDTLKIVGRSKETIVLLSGENVEPVPVENKLLQSPLIDQIMVVGQDKKTLAALIVPALDPMKKFGASLQELADNEAAADLLKTEARRLVNTSEGFKPFERVTDVRLLPKAFEPGDELSGKLSVKRHVVAEKYAGLIADMYKD